MSSGPRRDPTQRTGPASRPTPLPAPSRRWLLAAIPVLAAATTAGCTSSDHQTGPGESAADAAARGEAVATELDLVAAYDAASEQLPLLAGALAAVRGHHAEHARALGAPAPSPPAAVGAAGSGSAAGSSPPTASATAASSPAAVLDELARLEAVAATEHLGSCLAAAGSLAAVLASLHAAETCHVDLLVGLGAALPPPVAPDGPPAASAVPTAQGAG